MQIRGPKSFTLGASTSAVNELLAAWHSAYPDSQAPVQDWEVVQVIDDSVETPFYYKAFIRFACGVRGTLRAVWSSLLPENGLVSVTFYKDPHDRWPEDYAEDEHVDFCEDQE